MQYISVRTALRSMILLLSVFIVFHVLVISGIIPYGIVWGGRLKTHSEMLQMESISILILGLMICAVIVRMKYFTIKQPPLLLRVVFWLMFFFFALNTLGNLMAASIFEKAVFTPVTLVLALLCLRLSFRRGA